MKPPTPMSLTKIIPLHSMRLRLSLNKQLRRNKFSMLPNYLQRKLLHLTVVGGQAFSLVFGPFVFRIPN